MIPRSCFDFSKSFTVCFKPFFKSISAFQPIAVSRLTSNCFFGVPSGLLWSHSIVPSKFTAAATRSASERMLKSIPVPTFRNASCLPSSFLGASSLRADQFSRANTHALPRSSACRNSLNGLPVPQHLTEFSPFCLLL